MLIFFLANNIINKQHKQLILFKLNYYLCIFCQFSLSFLGLTHYYFSFQSSKKIIPSFFFLPQRRPGSTKKNDPRWRHAKTDTKENHDSFLEKCFMILTILIVIILVILFCLPFYIQCVSKCQSRFQMKCLPTHDLIFVCLGTT